MFDFASESDKKQAILEHKYMHYWLKIILKRLSLKFF